MCSWPRRTNVPARNGRNRVRTRNETVLPQDQMPAICPARHPERTSRFRTRIIGPDGCAKVAQCMRRVYVYQVEAFPFVVIPRRWSRPTGERTRSMTSMLVNVIVAFWIILFGVIYVLA